MGAAHYEHVDAALSQYLWWMISYFHEKGHFPLWVCRWALTYSSRVKNSCTHHVKVFDSTVSLHVARNDTAGQKNSYICHLKMGALYYVCIAKPEGHSKNWQMSHHVDTVESCCGRTLASAILSLKWISQVKQATQCTYNVTLWAFEYPLQKKLLGKSCVFIISATFVESIWHS